jgi:hypothetical protein
MTLPASLLALLLTLLACTGSRPPLTEQDIAVHVGTVALDPRTGSPLLILQESGGERALPIWIGFAEASSIASEIEQVPLPRPNSHDLVKRLVDGMGARVSRVVVTEMRGGTYFALLMLEARGRKLEIDARPSDAVAIALRMQAPLFVRENVFTSADGLPGSDTPEREAMRDTDAGRARTGSSWATSRVPPGFGVMNPVMHSMREGRAGSHVLPHDFLRVRRDSILIP